MEDRRLILIEVVNTIIIEAAGAHWSFWIAPNGKINNIGNLEHSDWFYKNIDKFGYKNKKAATPDIEKRRGDIYSIALEKGWIRGRFDDSELGAEFNKEKVSNYAVRHLLKLVSTNMKKNLSNVYYDLEGRNPKRGTTAAPEFIKMIRKYG